MAEKKLEKTLLPDRMEDLGCATSRPAKAGFGFGKVMPTKPELSATAGF
ncbi:MAG: hypothetical protein JSS76_07885 [Bacteroidetes bacterium]|nr:hypothetical protein [Bacteroidota bacterium]